MRRAVPLGLLFWITGFQPVTAVAEAIALDRTVQAYDACMRTAGQDDWTCEDIFERLPRRHR